MAADGQLPAFYLQQPELTDLQKEKESREVVESPFVHPRALVEMHTERYIKLRDKRLLAESDRRRVGVLPNGYRPDTLWLKKHVDRQELALRDLEAQKDICTSAGSRPHGCRGSSP